jgi:hypothetical protein
MLKMAVVADPDRQHRNDQRGEAGGFEKKADGLLQVGEHG